MMICKASVIDYRANRPRVLVGAVFVALMMFQFPVRAQDNPPAADLASCYWQDALNAAFCEHTISARLGIDWRNVDWNDQTYESVRGSGNITGRYRYRSRWLDEIGAVEVTPFSWLKLTAGTDYENFHDEESYDFTTHGIVRNPGPGRKVVDDSFWSWQSLEANFKVFDSGPADVRYFGHVFAEAGFVPGQDDVASQSRVGAGAEAGARWALSSLLALNARTVLAVDHFSYLDENIVYPSARMLLSADAAGLAVGPVYDGAILAEKSGGVGDHPASSLVGGEAVLQPFVRLDNAVLRDMILDAKAEHSVGAADFLPSSNASGMSYTATVSFNFHY